MKELIDINRNLLILIISWITLFYFMVFKGKFIEAHVLSTSVFITVCICIFSIIRFIKVLKEEEAYNE